jgi:cytoskeletal protein RodZ
LGAFGEKLRKQREQRGIELDKISNATKISTRMLRALEEEHFDQLPGGVFNKGFVRAYARQVGMDAEEAVTDYLAALRENQVQAQNILPDFRKSLDVAAPVASRLARPNDVPKNDVPKNDRGGNKDIPRDDVKPFTADPRERNRDEVRSNVVIRANNKKEDVPRRDRSSSPIRTGPLPEIQPESPGKPGIPWGKLAVALLVVSAVLAFWNLRRQSQLTDASLPAAASNPASPTVATVQPSVRSQPYSASSPPKIDQTKIDQAKIGQAKPDQTQISQATPDHAEFTAPPVSTLTSTTTPEAPSVAPAKSAPVRAASALSSDPNPPAAKASVHNPVAKSASTFTLLIRAEKTSWVSILADGKPVAEETLIAPAHTSVRAAREISVRTGNAAGISFLLNGKEIPAQGVDGEVRLYTFDAQGMKASEVQPPNSAH